ncbi:hypothetical protein AGMMS50268_15560 [Spirochaetia bacterium]|nr:hypothetical protein AGMMS50268_15560 [Spirochaetia bacterium]
MKNYKVIFMGILALALVFGFAGCQNGTQEVTGTVGVHDAFAGAGPTVPVVTKSSSPRNVLVRWDAAEGASSYSVYFREEGKKTITAVAGTGVTNASTYALDGGSAPNSAYDSWNERLSFVASGTNNSTQIIEGRTYRFGVQALRAGNGGMNVYSSIVWSDPITL